MLLDVFLDDPCQFLEQSFLRKRGHVHVIGGEDALQVGELRKDPSPERAEGDLDFAEQLGNETIDLASSEGVGFSRSNSSRHRWRRGHSCTHSNFTEAKCQHDWRARCFILRYSRCFSIPIYVGPIVQIRCHTTYRESGQVAHYK